jgi:transcription elongation factor GreA
MDSVSMNAEEFEALQAELGELQTTGRSEMAARIKTAREWGDLKENAEYHAAKEAQAHLETRILKLRDRVRNAVVVEADQQADVVQHGSTVTYSEPAAGKTKTFKIVSQHDAKPGEGTLSAASPIAQALLGQVVGATVEVQTPAGTRRLVIDAIA